MAILSRSVLVTISGLLLATSQNVLAQSPPTQDIIVTAPRVSVEKAGKGPSGIGTIMVYSADRRVSFADLDLTTDVGIDAFKARIRDAAKDGCAQISKEYPLVRDDSCERVAIARANVQADQIIEAAKS